MMSKLLFLLVLGAHADAPDFSKWGDWRASGMGSVLNPPRGRVDENVRRTAKFLTDLVHEIGGEPLARNHYQLAVTVVAHDAPNAFIARFSGKRELREMEEIDARNKAREERRARENWAAAALPDNVVHALNFDPEENIYQLGVTTGLLRTMKTRAQVAFVLGHELTHLFEGHLNSLRDASRHERFKSWWDSQRHELIADDGGVLKLVTKYPLDGAIESLNSLARVGDHGKDVILSLISDHHHDGMRVASLQARLEQLLRSKPGALVVGDEPLPAFTRIARSGRSESHANFAKQREVLLDIAREYPDSIAGLNQLFMKSDDRDPKSKYAPLWEGRATSAQYASALTDVLELLDAKDLPFTKARRIEALLVVLRVIAEGCPNTKFWNYVDANALIRLRVFLAKNAGGDWTPAHVLDALDGIDSKKKSHADAFLDIFSARAAGAKSVARLVNHAPAWRTFTREIAARKLGSGTDYYLRRLIANDGYYKMQPEALEVFRAASLAEITGSKDLDPLITQFSQDFGDTRFLFAELLERLKPESSEDEATRRFATALLAALSPQIERFVHFRDETLRGLMSDAGADPRRAISLLASGLQTLELAPFPMDLVRAVDDQILGALRRFEATDGERLRGISAPLIEVLTRQWDRPISPDDRAIVWRFIASEIQWTGSEVDEAPEPLRGELFRRFARYAGAFSPGEVIALSQTMHPRTERLFREYFKTHHDQEGTLDELATFATTLEGVIPKGFSEALELRTALGHDRNLRGSLLAWASYVPAMYDHLRAIDFKLLAATFTNLRELIEFNRKCELHFEFLRYLREWTLSAPAAEVALRLVIDREAELRDPETWRRTLDDVVTLNETAIDRRHEFRPRLAEISAERLARVAPADLLAWARTPALLRLLSPDRAAELLVEAIDGSLGRGSSFETARDFVRKLVEELQLERDHPDVHQLFRARWAEHRRQQPGHAYLPGRASSLTERTENYSSHVRGLSAMIAKVRQGDFDEQVATIEYLMGHEDVAPAYLTKLFVDTEMSARESALPLTGLLANARARLQRESVVVRAMVANSFLAGPRSVIADPAGVDRLIARVLIKFRPEAREFAEVIARAVIHAQGNSASLAFATILAQRRGAEEDPLSFEARMLNNLFSAFGVPGTKYAQYLAFSPHLSVYREALEDMQDAALPLNFLEAVELVEAKFGRDWPEHWEITDIEGSGAVNVAITLRDRRTNEAAILNVLRDQIRTASRYHFHKFRLALEHVLRDPRFGERFSYLKALSRIIETSVDLEFDKPRVARMFERVRPMYEGRHRGWHLTTPRVLDVTPEAITMTKAPGLSARKVFARDPVLYREAMRVFAAAEFEVLRGTSGRFPIRTRALVANPDVHDGQVYIDESTRTITVLDPGQTVEISNEEREVALDLLMFLTGASRAGDAASLLAREFRVAIESEALERVRDPQSPIDSFMRLVSLVEDAGGAVPLSILHWIIGAHRLVQLGIKVGVDYEARFGLLIKGRQWEVPNALTNLAFGCERVLLR